MKDGLSFRFVANRLLTRTGCAGDASHPELDNKSSYARPPVVMGDVLLLLAAIQLALFCSLSLAESFHAMSTDQTPDTWWVKERSGKTLTEE